MLSGIVHHRCSFTVRWLKFFFEPITQLKPFVTNTQNDASSLLKLEKDEVDRVLAAINSKSPQELSNFSISKRCLDKLLLWKQKHGIVQSLDDVLNIDTFSTEILRKFCKSLLSEGSLQPLPRKRSSYVIPNVDETKIDNIKSSVSINVGASQLTWSRLELVKGAPCNLTHWQHHGITTKRLHLHDLISHCLYIDQLIPTGDCYVFENPTVAKATSPGNAERVNINVQRAELTAVLGFALARRNNCEDFKSNLFYLKRYLAAKLFRTFVGTERISGDKVVTNLMRTRFNTEDYIGDDQGSEVVKDPRVQESAVCFPTELRIMYKESDGAQRELLGQAFLLNLAFVQLVLLKNPFAKSSVGSFKKSSE